MKTVSKSRSPKNTKKKKVVKDKDTHSSVTELMTEAKRMYDEQYDEDTVPVEMGEIVSFLLQLTKYLEHKEMAKK